MDPTDKSRAIAKVYRRMALNEQPSDFAYWQSLLSSGPPCREKRQSVAEFHGWTDDT